MKTKFLRLFALLPPCLHRAVKIKTMSLKLSLHQRQHRLSISKLLCLATIRGFM